MNSVFILLIVLNSKYYLFEYVNKLDRAEFFCGNSETDLPKIFEAYYSNETLRTCSSCGQKIVPPVKL